MSEGIASAVKCEDGESQGRRDEVLAPRQGAAARISGDKPVTQL